MHVVSEFVPFVSMTQTAPRGGARSQKQGLKTQGFPASFEGGRTVVFFQLAWNAGYVRGQQTASCMGKSKDTCGFVIIGYIWYSVLSLLFGYGFCFVVFGGCLDVLCVHIA